METWLSVAPRPSRSDSTEASRGSGSVGNPAIGVKFYTAIGVEF